MEMAFFRFSEVVATHFRVGISLITWYRVLLGVWEWSQSIPWVKIHGYTKIQTYGVYNKGNFHHFINYALMTFTLTLKIHDTKCYFSLCQKYHRFFSSLGSPGGTLKVWGYEGGVTCGVVLAGGLCCCNAK